MMSIVQKNCQIYQTGNREDLETSSSCFGSEYKVAEHFACFTGNIDRNLYFLRVTPSVFAQCFKKNPFHRRPT